MRKELPLNYFLIFRPLIIITALRNSETQKHRGKQRTVGDFI
jgi:hypothetical protein